MSGKGRNQRYVLKLSSTQLRHCKWNLHIKLKEAKDNASLVGLGESQLIRWLDEFNGIEDCENKITKIKRQIEEVRSQIYDDADLKPVLKSLYQQLDHYTYKPDYISVVIDKVADYKKLYKDGFYVNGVKYRRLLGTSGGIKLNTIVFVNEKFLPELKRRIANNRNMDKEFVPAKLEAYQALVCSSSIPVSMPKGVICVPDCYTHFKADVIELDDSEDGEPKMTFVKQKECELCENDGYGLGMPNLLKRWGGDLGEDYTLSGCVIRNSFCKGTIYPIDFQKFARDNGFTEIVDSWGVSHNVEEIELILTESMLKLWDSYSSIDEYLSNCEKNHYTFAITKAAEEKLENVRNMNYQFLQSYEFSDSDIEELIQPTVTEIQDVLLNDWRKTLCYLKGVNLSIENVGSTISSDFATALMFEPGLINDSFVHSQIQGMITKRINDAKKGILKVNGCYALVSGDPYSLCQSIFRMKVTGLLKAGEVYSRYWIDRGVKEAVMFRAPMSVENNIVKMRIVHNKQMDEFYKYMTTPIIFNSWDATADSMNGFDKDGDCVITTSNNVLLDNTKLLPAIHCVQYKASKIVPTEDDIVKSNLNGFGNAVGSITNKVTSMYEVQARFEKSSKEYDILQYRTKCGQLYQQAEIDKIKGIKAKPMPKYWYDFFDTKPKDDDSKEIADWKVFQRTIVADKKPYFFRYVYPTDNSNWLKYQKDNDFKAMMQFGKDIATLLSSDSLSKEEKDFLDNYKRRIPLGIAPCTVNRICWEIEKIFKSDKLKPTDTFDYIVLRNDDFLNDGTKTKAITKVYQEYLKERKLFDKYNHCKKMNEDDYVQYWKILNERFKRECTKICPNKYELCNILLDICYDKSLSSKRFVWEMCGDVIIQNLIKRHNGIINIPIQDETGDFEFSGLKFKMIQYDLNEGKKNEKRE